ncbi:MAG: hypothetical protein ACRDPJ_09755 [Nocardioidaceae bacterium]
MRGSRRFPPAAAAAAAAALALAVLPGTAGAAEGSGKGADAVALRIVFAFTDDRIDESSGLVARDRLVFTVNDSGDGPYFYGVDPGSGDTRVVSIYADDEPDDVEALASGPGGEIWVGDIGDNNRQRSTVTVHRVEEPGQERPRAERFELAYPDGPHDAETLLVNPRTGRLYVVTKVPVFGGGVYEAPAGLETGTIQRMAKVGTVPGLVTDGAFFPDGRHVLLRTYGSAAVYTFPGFEPVGEFALPQQEQGEGVAISGPGRILLSSEGARSDVLEVELPAEVRDAMGRGPANGASPAPEEQAGSTSATKGPAKTSNPASGKGDGDGVGLGRPAGYVLGVVAVILVGALVRASRRRGRRTQ